MQKTHDFYHSKPNDKKIRQKRSKPQNTNAKAMTNINLLLCENINFFYNY